MCTSRVILFSGWLMIAVLCSQMQGTSVIHLRNSEVSVSDIWNNSNNIHLLSHHEVVTSEAVRNRISYMAYQVSIKTWQNVTVFVDCFTALLEARSSQCLRKVEWCRTVSIYLLCWHNCAVSCPNTHMPELYKRMPEIVSILLLFGGS